MLAKAVRKRAESDLAELARRGLHLVNLPAGTDISKVSQQVAGLEREIRQLNRRIETLQSEAAGAEAASPAKKQSAKKKPANKKPANKKPAPKKKGS